MAADGLHKETYHDEHQRAMDEEAGRTPAMHETKEGDSSPEKSPTRAGTDEQGAHMEWTFTRVVAIISLCFVYVGAQEILYFTGGALSYISVSIDTQVPNWLLTANTLAVTATCPFVGYLTDMLGRRWMAVLGSLLLFIASMVLAWTESLGSAVTAEALGGIGAGICELTALAGVAEITPARWRGVTLAIVTFSIVPFMPYLIYVEEFQQNYAWQWRWIFIICAVWNFIGLFGLVFFYHPPPRHNVDGLSKMQIAAKIDYVGAFLSISGVTLFLVGLQAGGYQFPWTSAKVLAPLIIGLLLILLFPAWEIWGAKNPMVPSVIFKGQRVVALAFAIVFVAGMNFYSVLGFFPLVLQTFYVTTPIQIGVRSLCYPIGILGGACIVSFLMSYTRGHVREMFFIVATLMTVFGGALAAATPFNPSLALAMATIDSFGIGALVVPSLTLALYACPDKYIGTTAALSLSVRFLGGSIGTAIYYNIFHSKIQTLLPQYVGQAAVAAGLPQDELVPFITALSSPEGAAQALAKIPGVTQDIIQQGALALRWAYADSLKYVWYATIPFGVVTMVCCLFLPNIRKYMTGRVAVDLH